MRKSWTGLFRRLAAGCIIAGASEWYSAMCYAQVVASDVATDPVYADGWQAGDNGGTGFSPWNFETDTFVSQPGTQAIDNGLKSGGGNPNSSAYNDLGQAWRLALPDQGALPRAGRGFAPLQVGQTLRVVTDNPTSEKFFKGYFIRLNSTSLGRITKEQMEISVTATHHAMRVPEQPIKPRCKCSNTLPMAIGLWSTVLITKARPRRCSISARLIRTLATRWWGLTTECNPISP